VLGIDVGAATPANTKPGSSLGQRIAQRKKERKIKLDRNNIERVQNQCTRTQGKLRTLSDSYTRSIDNRSKVYRVIDAKLWIIIGSLKFIDKDTFKLEQNRLNYLKEVKAFDNSSAQFKQTIDDIMAMNCRADPNGFISLVATARLYNQQVRTSFKDIKGYLVNEVKPTITQYSDDLKIKTSTE
jgi:hypothetical protein